MFDEAFLDKLSEQLADQKISLFSVVNIYDKNIPCLACITQFWIQIIV